MSICTHENLSFSVGVQPTQDERGARGFIVCEVTNFSCAHCGAIFSINWSTSVDPDMFPQSAEEMGKRPWVTFDRSTLCFTISPREKIVGPTVSDIGHA